jgi:hypothetical protein
MFGGIDQKKIKPILRIVFSPRQTLALPMTLDELFYGKDYAARKEGFKKALKAIEETHCAYFEARESRYPAQPHDFLHNHYVHRVEGDQVGFGFILGTDLDPAIQEACQQAFLHWFGSDSVPDPQRVIKSAR